MATTFSAPRQQHVRISRLAAFLLAVIASTLHLWAAPPRPYMTLTLSSNSIASGTPVTLSATVTTVNGSRVTTGQVNFCDATAAYCTDIHLLGTAQITPAGTATFSYIPRVGQHEYKAIFLGTNSVATQFSPTETLTVTGTYPTTTTLTASGSPGNYTLSATVAGSGPFAPTGTVSFLDTDNNNYVLSSSTLTSTSTSLAFQNSATPASGLGPESTALADFNGDGKLDMAVASVNSNSITILLGNGDGTFTTAPTLTTGSMAIDVVAADFNSDGKMDLAVTNQGSNTLSVFLGNGDGTFTLKSNPPTGNQPFAIAAGDFNNDGIEDMAVANLVDNSLTILIGNGDGTFTVSPNTYPTGVNPAGMLAADFNNDGKLDIAVASCGCESNGSAPITANTLTILLGNGDGTFTAAPSPVTALGPWDLVAADFNNDGNADLAVSDVTSGTVTVLLGKGDGTFTKATVSPAVGGFPTYAITTGDLNGDGKADLAATDSTNSALIVLLGNGDGTFTQTTSPATGLEPDFVNAADFNGDGNADIATANYGGNSTTVLLTQSASTTTVTGSGISPVGTGTHYIDASYGGDTNFSSSLSNTVPLVAELEPTTLALTAAPTGTSYGQQIVLTAVLTPDTAQNHNATGTVTFSYNGTSLGTGGISGGVATLNTTSLPAGSDTVTAVYSGDTNFATSTTTAVIVIAKASQTINFPQPTSPVTYGIGTITLSATATSGLPVTFSVLSGPAAVSGNTLTITGGGTVVVAADQAGNSNYNAAPEVARSIVVTPITANIAVTTKPTAVFITNPVTITATLSSPLGIPTGAVTFYDGTTALSSATLSSGIASVTLPFFSLGTHTLTASYYGDATFNPNSSTATTLLVQDFNIVVTGSASQTAVHGTTATYTLLLTPTNGTTMPQDIKLSIPNPLPSAVVTFTPATVVAGSGATSVTVNYLTPWYPTGGELSSRLRILPTTTLAMLLFGAMLPLRLRSKRLQRLGCVLILIAGLLGTTALTGCGSGWNVGYFGVYFTGTSGNLSHSVYVKLTIH